MRRNLRKSRDAKKKTSNKNIFKANSIKSEIRKKKDNQTLKEVKRRKSTLRAKLKIASQEEKLQKWKKFFQNLLWNSHEVTNKPIKNYQ